MGIVPSFDAEHNLVTLGFPANPLTTGNYRVVLHAGVRDLGNNPLATGLTWTFAVEDRERPQLLSLSPAAGSEALEGVSEVALFVDEPLGASSLAGAIKLFGAGPNGVFYDEPLPPGFFDHLDDVEITGGTLVFEPSDFGLRLKFSSALPPGRYLVRTSPSIADLAGNLLFEPFLKPLEWKFTVVRETALSGLVTFPDGSPAANARVEVVGRAETLTGPDGRFVFPALRTTISPAPILRATVTAHGRDYYAEGRGRTPRSGATDAGVITLGERCDATVLQIANLVGNINAFATFNDGAGSALYAGTDTYQPTGARPRTNHLARWNGVGWDAVGGGIVNRLGEASVKSLVTFDDGSGTALYVGGLFTTVGIFNLGATPVAKWDGTAWSRVDNGFGRPQYADVMAVFNDGSGLALFVGGANEYRVGREIGTNIFKWTGSAWLTVGDGPNQPRTVSAMAVFDDGTGPALFTAGQWFDATSGFGGQVRKWNGSQWTVVGGSLNGTIYDLAVFDDGTGPTLYAGGQSLTGQGALATGLAKWTGSEWAPVPGLSSARTYPLIRKLLVDASGPRSQLLVMGTFEQAGEIIGKAEAQGFPLLLNIARWDGTRWTDLAGQLNAEVRVDGEVRTAAWLGTGATRQLFVGGRLSNVYDASGKMPVSNAARWDGHGWTPAHCW